MLDIVVPVMGESVAEGSIGSWSKKAGDAVKKDEILVEIETDKVALEVVAPADGVLAEILAKAPFFAYRFGLRPAAAFTLA